MSLFAKLPRDRVHPFIEESSRGLVLHGPVRKARRIDGHTYIGTAVRAGNESASDSWSLPAAPESAVGRHRYEHQVISEYESSNPGRQPAAEPCPWSIGQQRAQVRAKGAPDNISGCRHMKRSSFAWPEHWVRIPRPTPRYSSRQSSETHPVPVQPRTRRRLSVRTSQERQTLQAKYPDQHQVDRPH